MGSEPDSGLACRDCGGHGDACICEDLDRVLAEAPTPPETPTGYDWVAWLRGEIRASNEGHPDA